MAKPNSIELPGIPPIPILYEDRAVMAIDKPRNWMLVPFNWQRTNRNLQAAIVSSIAAGDYWAKSRSLKFLRYVHRLDAETTGILLFAKSQGAVEAYSDLFESRRMEKTYLAVSSEMPKAKEWTCRFALAQDEHKFGRMKVDAIVGKASETHFKVLQVLNQATPKMMAAPTPRADLASIRANETHAEFKARKLEIEKKLRQLATTISPKALIEAHPLTGRTHQIRVHMAESGCPVFADEIYGERPPHTEMGLRAVRLCFADPFTRKPVDIRATIDKFCREYGFDIPKL
ncbi:MAG: RluA family pseudouridine synthase [Verrucomicrobia bacterium]|nr:MAG: RluA family pseudouridine synthase [Verrucomicrobiota bacterium]